MADTTADAGVPTITQGQTTSPGADAHIGQDGGPAILEGEAAQKAPSIFDNWLIWAVAALWIWFLFGNKKRRQARQNEKIEQERRGSLQKGDNIVTIGRVHGKVVSVNDKTVTIKVDPKSDYTLTFDREAIFRVLPRPGEAQTDEQQQAAADAAAGGNQNNG